MQELLTHLPLVTGILGVLAFVVSIIVQVTKDIAGIKLIPTKTWTIVVSILVCVFSYLGYVSYVNIAITMYCIIGVVIGSFLVAYIATYGWDSFNETYQRFKNLKNNTDTQK